MAEVAPEPVAAAAPTKTTKKKPATRTKRAGPSVGELIVKAVSASKERNGVSLAALKKALAAGGYDVEKNSHRVRNAVKHLVAKETLVQTKGVGASGSFKVNKKQQEAAKKKPAKKAAPKAKKPVAKKASPAKKPKKVAAKKPAAKKSPKKAKKPAAAAKKVVAKKAKKPVAAKKSAKSPKKAKPVKPKVAKPKATKPKKAAKKK